MDSSVVGKAAVRRVTTVLIPFLMFCYLVSFIDRVNVGFAAFQMNKDLGLSSSVFGLGGGLFFLSYFLFEVPSNLAMRKYGARRWIARIMLSWGLISGCTAFVTGPYSFYVVRFLLGAAEAGFFPGVILYLTQWFPAENRGRIVSLFYVAVPLSSFVGSPISASLLGLEGMGGLHGWQWLFIIEAIPAVLLAAVTFFWLPEGPADARWLADDQKRWLSARLEAERRLQEETAPVRERRTWRVLMHPQVLLLSLVYAGTSAASNGLSLWQPQILKSFGLTNAQTGWLNSLPFAIASIAMIWWGNRSDRTGERVASTAIPLALSACALGACLFMTQLAPTVMFLVLTLVGTYAFKGPFWALSTERLGPEASAAGLAQINAVGNLAGFGGTFLIGVIRDATGSYALALAPVLVLQLMGFVLLMATRRHRAPAASSGPAGLH
ncbi:Sugar phosphate permease [Chitinasiproducens palmae]|uniref:Sugar phosphate permease n=2 Tax=Chitinasiproducens palmae TaxID=1770053 RepID=A0A1H2PK90_9BURK|nr:MFS transporter [Chitinasiproducens palmae]SDV46859.1 Sugar phosphate permease [Chitinasiproducens palmae]